MSAERIITADELRDVAFVTLDTRAVAALARAINTIKALTAEVERLSPPERPDGLPADAVPSPWTPGAWIVLARDVPEGWEVRGATEEEWASLCTCWDDDDILEARPPAKPATVRVPWWEAVGRTLPHGEMLGRIVQAHPSEGGPGGMYVEFDLPERGTTGNPHRYPDGTVEVLAEDGDR